jgi:hypothetical protein
MEINVWMQLFAQVANFLSRLLSSLTEVQRQASPTSSSNVQGSDAVSLSTSRITPENRSLLQIKRNPKMATTDALFGDMAYNGERIGFTMERTAVAIPEGTYKGYKRDSAHFGMRVVGIDVPNRTNIECHPANQPSQLLGCVAIGETIDNDALDNSRSAFDRMMATVPEEFTVEVSSSNN